MRLTALAPGPILEYCLVMTSTPMEPETEPEVVPSGDPGMDPVNPSEEPSAPVPEADPTGA